MPSRTPRDELPDEQLVERARAGDRQAYGELVRRHQSAALRLAAGVCGSTEEARDIVQDAFVKGYRALGRYRGEASVRSWLLRIVANEAKNEVRGRSRRRLREDRHERMRLVAADGDPVGDRVAAEVEAAELLDLLGRLDERDREVLACRFVAGLSEAETAATLGVAPGTVKSRTGACARTGQGARRTGVTGGRPWLSSSSDSPASP